jgi:hypothetical protein
MGFKRYGFHKEAARIAHDVSLAASHFLLNQLPELYTHPSAMKNFPVHYIGANVPQAWAAGSVFMLTQALLGFLPAAPHNKLYVDPYLPAWLPDLTVHDFRIGKHMLDIRFWREGEETAFEVIKGDAKLVDRRNIATEGLGLRTRSDLVQASRGSAERSRKSTRKRKRTWRARSQSG